MRKLCGLFILLVTIYACNKIESKKFDQDKLIGRYKVDVTTAIDQFKIDDEKEHTWLDAVKKITSAAISSLNLKVNFEENSKGTVEVNENMLRLAQKLTDEPLEHLNEFWYKVEQDSIIFLKKEEQDEFKKWGILKNISNNYDSIKMYVLNNNKKDEKLYVNLVRIEE